MNMHVKSRFVTVTIGLLCISTVFCSTVSAQRKKKKQPVPAAVKDSSARPPMMPPPGTPKGHPKQFGELIPAGTRGDSGLFNFYKIEDKLYFEIADSLLSRDILVVNRISKSAAGLRAMFYGYSGDLIGENVIRFEKGPNNRIFLKNVSYSEISRDSTQPMFHAVMNSNIQPIAAAFDIKAFSKEKNGCIIDMTDYINGDNDILFFDQRMKTGLRLGGMQPDKSYVVDIRSYPINTEIKTVKTYAKSGGPGRPGMPPAGPGGNATLELNSSLVLLPEVPMQPRYFDPRIGYFTTSVTDFDADPQGVKRLQMITRWRLEPREEDREKYQRGELVEPKKPIIFYIDPATPAKWRPYLMQGVNDWQAAFEQAGFKNAILAKMAPTPEEDSTWSLEDARFSAIVYKPSDIANASGPHVHDPRSGEILESHINWYHNVMHLLRNWYFIQCAPNDPRARTMEFNDTLMGELIRFVSSHEVGHTLGLRHNFGASSAYPVEKLRDKAWVEKNGHAPSIMDYARFNYVAQPEDSITGTDLYPRINYYDKWAIEWGYRQITGATSPEAEKATLNKWTINRLKDKRYWFGTERNPDDPRSQNEDLGDDAMKASYYGIKNLQRLMPNLMAWTRESNEGYGNLGEMYREVAGQYGRYMGHVAKNVGGIYETPKTVEQEGAVYMPVPKATQQAAIRFLNQQLFTTPKWLLDNEILSRTGSLATTVVMTRQDPVLEKLLSSHTLNKLLNTAAMEGSKAYQATDMLNDLKKGIFSEVYAHRSIDIFRRNLQKAYVRHLTELLAPGSSPGSSGGTNTIILFGNPPADPTRTDVSSIARAQLTTLRNELRNAAAAMPDNMSRYHLNDLVQRINTALEPK
ncbi:zinc-dependent metalloprotease [Chitinophaga japonensis]|uniref:zinc-dependent metalloprotease n=1 Tax=Chitinophaga japonensis TaxID=104662 RepID=UPI001FCF286E|nr:zinc-dependent metalloprotease [Chitinophaga japonensis]